MNAIKKYLKGLNCDHHMLSVALERTFPKLCLGSFDMLRRRGFIIQSNPCKVPVATCTCIQGVSDLYKIQHNSLSSKGLPCQT
jgi:hypothetical protein